MMKTQYGFDDIMNITKEKVVDLSTVPINYIAFVLDHSGSMSDIAERSRQNFNEQLQQIKTDSADQKNYVTVVEFSDKVHKIYENEDIDNIKEMSTYRTNGCTALYDAIACAIDSVENSMDAERANTAALIVIITDGHENSSTEHRGDSGRLRIKSRIEELQKGGKWTFVFMGAEQNVLETAVEGLGIYASNTMSFFASSQGVMDASKEYMKSYTSWSNSRGVGASSSTNFFNKEENV
jgi:uncharacterized protein YegL